MSKIINKVKVENSLFKQLILKNFIQFFYKNFN